MIVTEFSSKYYVSLCVIVNGRSRKIRFTELSSGGSHYVCDDPDECKAIKKDSGFGSIFNVTAEKTSVDHDPSSDQSNPVNSVASTSPTDELGENAAGGTTKEPDCSTEYSEITTNSDAVAILVARGAKRSKLTNKANIKNIASELGIAFPNL